MCARRLRGAVHVSEKESAAAASHCRQNLRELVALHRALEASVEAFEAAAQAEAAPAQESDHGLAPAEHDRIQILQ